MSVVKGHYFTWVGDGVSLDADPPPDCPCQFCGTAYKDVPSVSSACLGRWSKSPARVAMVHALQGTE